MPATMTKITCPVCGMDIKKNLKLMAEHKGQTYYFCSQNDMKKFKQQPQVYAWKEPAGKIA